MSDANNRPDATGRTGWKIVAKLWSIVLALSILTGSMIGGIYPICSMAEDVILHFTGVVAPSGSCEIQRLRGIKYSATNLLVDYVSADGSKHSDSEAIDWFMWLRDPDESVPCEVRYSRTQPSHYGTSWGYSRIPSRLVTWVLLQAWWLALGLFFAGRTIFLLTDLWELLFPTRR